MNEWIPPLAWVIPIVAYAFGTSITPGPNNTISAITGANFGFRAGMPHVFGVAVGFSILLLIAASGVAAFLLAFPQAGVLLKAVGIAWLLWLAWKLWSSAAMGEGPHLLRPMRMHESALFQLSNPKAWVMAIGVSTNFVGQISNIGLPLQLLYIFCIFSAINIPCQAFWCAVGSTLRHWLKVGKRLQIFNGLMAVLLAFTAISLVWL